MSENIQKGPWSPAALFVFALINRLDLFEWNQAVGKAINICLSVKRFLEYYLDISGERLEPHLHLNLPGVAELFTNL